MADNMLTVNYAQTPAQIEFSSSFNVAVPFIDRHLDEGRANKLAIVGDFCSVSYAELAKQVNRCGNVLVGLGLPAGARILMVVKDCPEFFYLFWGPLKRGLYQFR